MKRTMFLAVVLLLNLAGNVFGQRDDDYTVQQLSNGTLRIVRWAKWGTKPAIKDGTYTIPRELYGIRVTSIGEDFKLRVDENLDIKRIIIPDTITEIRGQFYRWMNTREFKSSVEEIRIPGSVIVLGDGTFGNIIEGFADIVIPSSVKSIGKYIFIGVLTDQDVRELVIEGVIQEVGGALGIRNVERIIFPANWNNDYTLNKLELPENFVNYYKSQGRKGGVYVRRGQIWTFDASASYTSKGYGGVFLSEKDRLARQEAARQEAARQQEAARKEAEQAKERKEIAKQYFKSGRDAYYNEKDNKNAFDYFTKAIQNDPDHKEAYFFRAWTYKGPAGYPAQDVDKAIADFTQAIRIDPKYLQAYTERGRAYMKKGDYDKAIADFTEQIRLETQPKLNAYAYNDRAEAYIKKGDFRQARADIDKALQLDPSHKWAKETDAELKKKGY